MSKEENEGNLKKRINELFVPFIKYTEGKTPLFINLPEALKGYVEDVKKSIPNIPDEDDPQFMFPDSYVPQIKAWLKEQFGK